MPLRSDQGQVVWFPRRNAFGLYLQKYRHRGSAGQEKVLFGLFAGIRSGGHDQAYLKVRKDGPNGWSGPIDPFHTAPHRHRSQRQSRSLASKGVPFADLQFLSAYVGTSLANGVAGRGFPSSGSSINAFSSVESSHNIYCCTHTFSYLPDNFHFTGITVSQKQAYVGMSVVSVVVLFYLLSHIFWWTMFTSGFLVGTHAALRDASMHKDEEDRVAMSGDLSLEEEQSAFLGDEV